MDKIYKSIMGSVGGGLIYVTSMGLIGGNNQSINDVPNIEREPKQGLHYEIECIDSIKCPRLRGTAEVNLFDRGENKELINTWIEMQKEYGQKMKEQIPREKVYPL